MTDEDRMKFRLESYPHGISEVGVISKRTLLIIVEILRLTKLMCAVRGLLAYSSAKVVHIRHSIGNSKKGDQTYLWRQNT